MLNWVGHPGALDFIDFYKIVCNHHFLKWLYWGIHFHVLQFVCYNCTLSVSFSTFIQFCKHGHSPVLGHFHRSRKFPHSGLLSVPVPIPAPCNYCFLSLLFSFFFSNHPLPPSHFKPLILLWKVRVGGGLSEAILQSPWPRASLWQHAACTREWWYMYICQWADQEAPFSDPSLARKWTPLHWPWPECANWV